jgi:RHS repeat-associated protein
MNPNRSLSNFQDVVYQYTYNVKKASGVCLQNTTDYSPFGVALDGRTMQSYGYRFGFGGHEQDNEVKGMGNSYTSEFRQLDPRVGRWLSLDILTNKAASWSGYRSFFCNPIRYKDSDGKWEWDQNGNLRAQKGDDAHSLAKFLGSSESNAITILKRSGVRTDSKGRLNLKIGQTLNKENLWVGVKYINVPIVKSTKEALQHYYYGNGQSVDVGDKTTSELLSSPEFTKAHFKITNGLSDSDHGFVKVEMEALTFYVGTTQFKYDVSSNGKSNSVNYKLFYNNVWGSDGFWDPDIIDENTLGKIPLIRDWTGTKPDGPGPNLERGGTPYYFKIRERTYFYKPPVE